MPVQASAPWLDLPRALSALLARALRAAPATQPEPADLDKERGERKRKWGEDAEGKGRDSPFLLPGPAGLEGPLPPRDTRLQPGAAPLRGLAPAALLCPR